MSVDLKIFGINTTNYEDPVTSVLVIPLRNTDNSMNEWYLIRNGIKFEEIPETSDWEKSYYCFDSYVFKRDELNTFITNNSNSEEDSLFDQIKQFILTENPSRYIVMQPF